MASHADFSQPAAKYWNILPRFTRYCRPCFFGFIVFKSPFGSWARTVSWPSFQSSLCLCYRSCLKVGKHGGESWGVLTPTGLVQILGFFFQKEVPQSQSLSGPQSSLRSVARSCIVRSHTLYSALMLRQVSRSTSYCSSRFLRAWLCLGFTLISSWPICNCSVVIQHV